MAQWKGVRFENKGLQVRSSPEALRLVLEPDTSFSAKYWLNPGRQEIVRRSSYSFSVWVKPVMPLILSDLIILAVTYLEKSL